MRFFSFIWKLITGQKTSIYKTDSNRYSIIKEDGRTLYEVDGVIYQSIDQIQNPDVRKALENSKDD